MPAERLDRKVTVILATDVAAYSKHVEQDESLTIETYSEREAVLLKLIKDFHGRVFNTAGDSVLAEFASAVDAVECAAAFQVQMVEINSQPDTECKLEFRIGINMGDVVQKDGNLLGDGVNIAARLEALSQPNGVSVSKSIHELVAPKTNFTFNDLGTQQVKKNHFYAYDLLLAHSSKRSLGKPLIKRPPVIALAIAIVSVIGLSFLFWDTREQHDLTSELFLDSKAVKILVGDIRPLTKDQATSNLAIGLTQAIRSKLNDYNEVSLPPEDLRDRLISGDGPDADALLKLNIAYLISGTVQRSGEVWRIIIELADNVRSKVIWSETIDFAGVDGFAIQDAVSNEVLASTMTKVTMGEDAALDRLVFTDAEHFLTFMNWRSNFLTRTPESLIRAEKIADELLPRLPVDNVYKYLVAGWNAFARLNNGSSPDQLADEKILYDAIDTSLRVDPGYAHNLAGLTAMFFEKDCVKASYHIKAFVEAAKNANRIRQMGYVLIPCGEAQSAIEFLNIALKLEPNAKNAEIKQMIIAAHMFAGDVSMALEVANGFMKSGLQDQATRNLVAYIHLLDGDLKAASSLSAELEGLETIDEVQLKKAARVCGYFCLSMERHSKL